MPAWENCSTFAAEPLGDAVDAGLAHAWSAAPASPGTGAACPGRARDADSRRPRVARRVSAARPPMWDAGEVQRAWLAGKLPAARALAVIPRRHVVGESGVGRGCGNCARRLWGFEAFVDAA